MAESLSKAENEVLSLVKKGISNKRIGERLFVTEKTVKFHLTNIYRKLDVRNRSELLVKEFNSDEYIGEENMKEKEFEVLPSNPLARVDKPMSQIEKVNFIDDKFKVGEAINQLHGMMKSVTDKELNAHTVNAACNCVARINETIDTAIKAARFLNER